MGNPPLFKRFNPMSRSATERLSAADVSAVLDRFGGHDLLARGSVNVISLATIRDRAGERWARKRLDVWAYAERRLAEHLTFQDLAQRVGETDYLIAMTSEEGVAAQAVALKVLEEVLMHFLGVAEPRDMAVRAVTDLNGEEVVCAPLDPLAILKTRASTPPPVAKTPAVEAPRVDPDEEKRRNPYIFRTATGLPLRIDFAVEELVSLKHGVVAALRIEPTVTETLTGRVIPARAFAKLSDIDLATIDQATMDYAALYLPRIDQPGQPALIVPVSFRTMGASKGRQALIAAGEGYVERMKASVMIELVDIDHGTPSGRLTEVAGLLKTLCRGVFARVQPGPGALPPLKEARLMGVTLDASDLSGDESRMAAQILDFGRQAKGLAPAISVQGLPSPLLFAIAETAGLTHASTRGPLLTAERPAA